MTVVLKNGKKAEAFYTKSFYISQRYYEGVIISAGVVAFFYVL